MNDGFLKYQQYIIIALYYGGNNVKSLRYHTKLNFIKNVYIFKDFICQETNELEIVTCI